MGEPSRFPYPSWVRRGGTYVARTEAELAALRADFLDRWERALPNAQAAVREFVEEMRSRKE